jgi:Thiol:disulfide interchange protein DsbD, N-terminal
MPKILLLFLFVIIAFSSARAEEKTDSLVTVTTQQIHSKDGIEISFNFEIKKDWHLYWVNPGDAGLPISFDWELPEGIKLDTILYPIPHKIIEAGITSFVYEESVAIIAILKITDKKFLQELAKTIQANISWLACKEICLPGGTSLEIKIKDNRNNLAILNPDQNTSVKISRNVNDYINGVSINGDEIIIKYAEYEVPTDFYPDEQGFYTYEIKIDKVNKTMTLPLDPFRVEDPKRLSGILVLDNKSELEKIQLDSKQHENKKVLTKFSKYDNTEQITFRSKIKISNKRYIQVNILINK